MRPSLSGQSNPGTPGPHTDEPVSEWRPVTAAADGTAEADHWLGLGADLISFGRGFLAWLRLSRSDTRVARFAVCRERGSCASCTASSASCKEPSIRKATPRRCITVLFESLSRPLTLVHQSRSSVAHSCHDTDGPNLLG
ncbi:hypothetical protein GCM10023191_078420 [Actinoallomurus oryzae]|uniref:Uncharacterized protein n=1 Tax=Actinoallomurus oryzae TaxID=502180 RepID=A0ABP8QXJ1_9ACTN